MIQNKRQGQYMGTCWCSTWFPIGKYVSCPVSTNKHFLSAGNFQDNAWILLLWPQPLEIWWEMDFDAFLIAIVCTWRISFFQQFRRSAFTSIQYFAHHGFLHGLQLVGLRNFVLPTKHSAQNPNDERVRVFVKFTEYSAQPKVGIIAVSPIKGDLFPRLNCLYCLLMNVRPSSVFPQMWIMLPAFPGSVTVSYAAVIIRLLTSDFT